MIEDKNAIAVSGLTLLYEPEVPASAVLDIVFVSGLGGHPLHTWQMKKPPASCSLLRSGDGKGSLRGRLKNSFVKRSATTATAETSRSEPRSRSRSEGQGHRVLRKERKDPRVSKSDSKLLLSASKTMPGPRISHSTGTLPNHAEKFAGETSNSPAGSGVYWPLDLLPKSCPDTRIMTWGAQTLTANGRLLPAQNNVFGHGNELLGDVGRFRKQTKTEGRSIIFITHSLGGIVLKEALRRAENSLDPAMKDVLHSTLATLFFGCPHRDSKYGRVSEAVQSMASVTLDVNPGDQVLRDVAGATNANLLLGRQAFLRLWNDHNFRVWTYHEQHPEDTDHGECENDWRQRSESSTFGDPREHTESVEAPHSSMCVFESATNQTYRSVAFTLLRFIQDEIERTRQLSPMEYACLRLLRSTPSPQYRGSRHTDSYPGTCLWLYDLPEFKAWHTRALGGRGRVLWIKGSSGSGRTVLLDGLRARIEKKWVNQGASVIWANASQQHGRSSQQNGHGLKRQHAALASVYRTILARLYKQDPLLRRALVAMWEAGCDNSADPECPFGDSQIISFADRYASQKIETPIKRTFIFVDATDSDDSETLRHLLDNLGILARNSDFSICIATATMPGLSADNAIEVVMQHKNSDDILRYISLNLVAEWDERNRVVARIGEKANGCFLWAEIATNVLNAIIIGDSASQEVIEDIVAELPHHLEGLYTWLLATLEPHERAEALSLMQWAILASEPMRLNDLRTAVRLNMRPSQRRSYRSALELDYPTHICDLRHPSDAYCAFDSPYSFHQWVRARSLGLLELRRNLREQAAVEPLGLQRVHVIHDSVRSFFLSGRGFACLQPRPTDASQDLIDQAHFGLVSACLAFLGMKDFEPIGAHHVPMASIGPPPLQPPPAPPLLRQHSLRSRLHAHDQRQLITSSYPFLQYAVDNLLYHLLSPRAYRYHLPQTALLRTLAANQRRLWRRWTALMGCGCSSRQDVVVVLQTCLAGPPGPLLDPSFGADVRLERVFRKLARMVAADAAPGVMWPPVGVGNRVGGVGSGGGVGDGQGTKTLRATRSAETLFVGTTAKLGDGGRRMVPTSGPVYSPLSGRTLFVPRLASRGQRPAGAVS